MRALQAHGEGWGSEGIWEKDRHEHGGRLVARADRMLAQPEQPLVCLATLSALLSLLIFTLEAPALPALQQPNLFSTLCSCLLMCFRHRNFIKDALMSTGFSHGLYH